ncbi:MAG: hypothetical protein PW788_08875 [Micavibrio sp.]|nr:hypothetical protein [Micavibrio sp.]
MNRRLNKFLLKSIGMLLGVFIITATLCAPAWSEETGTAGDASANVSTHKESPAAIAAEDKKAEHREAGAEDREEAENIGFPQLNPKSYASQAFWLLVSFALLYTLMSKVALPRVASVIDTRQQTQNGNLSQAEQLNAEAAKVKEAFEASLAKAHDSAQEVLAAAEESITDKATAEHAKFAEHARNRILSAEQNIAKAKEDALSSLADISAEIAAEMVNKIAGVQVAKADAKKIVTTVMKERA